MIPEPPYNPDQVYEIDLAAIFVDELFNCRGPVDPMHVIDLAKDIEAHGLDQPVTVQPWAPDSVHRVHSSNKKFRLIAGYRRYKAHQMNKAQTIRALVKVGLNDFDARLLNIRENVQREELNIKQEAHAIEIFKNAGWTEMETAKQVNMSRGWVQIRYMLLEMPEQIQDEAAAGLLSTTNIRQLYSLTSPEEQFAFVRELKDKKLKGKVREIKPYKVKINQRKIRTTQELDEMQDLIRQTFGNNLTTQILGWALGYNSDLEVHKFIAGEAQKQGKYYIMPDGLQGTHAVAS